MGNGDWINPVTEEAADQSQAKSSEADQARAEAAENVERLQVLELFAKLILTAAGTPWIDNQIQLINAELVKPGANTILLHRLLILFQAGRQITAAPAPPPSTPAPPSPDAETAARKQLIDEAIIEDRTMERAKSYEQLIIGLGYGAYFALWSTMGPKLSRGEVLLSGGLMGISLIVYISYHLVVMVWQQTWQIKATQVTSLINQTFSERLDKFRSVQFARYANAKFLLLAWRILFPIQVVFGLLGAVDLTLAAISAAIPTK